MRPEDVFILLKIAVLGSCDWTPFQLSLELGHSPEEIESSVERLLAAKLIRSTRRPDPDAFKKFLIMDLPQKFSTRPGGLTRGLLTGAKPGMFFTGNLSYTSIWVWPDKDGPDWGYAIDPLSPHCCFAALQDRKFRTLLAITETLRVAGKEARVWAEMSLRQNGLF